MGSNYHKRENHSTKLHIQQPHIVKLLQEQKTQKDLPKLGQNYKVSFKTTNH